MHGSTQFDKLTKTKTVETILTSMTQDGIQSYIEYLLKQVNDGHTYVSFPFIFSSFARAVLAAKLPSHRVRVGYLWVRISRVSRPYHINDDVFFSFPY